MKKYKVVYLSLSSYFASRHSPKGALSKIITTTSKKDGILKNFKLWIVFLLFNLFKKSISGLGKFTPEDIDARKCTHIYYGHAKVCQNQANNWTLCTTEWNDIDELTGHYKKLPVKSALKSLKMK